MSLAQFRKHRIKPDFHFSGQNALKLSKRFVCVGFLQTHVSRPESFNFISTSRKGMVSAACSAVNLIFLCWEFNKSRKLMQDLSSGKTAKISSTYRKYNLEGSEDLN